MRVEPYTVDSYIHVVKRGARGLPIVRDSSDQKRFARLLLYMNDKFKDDSWEREISDLGLYERPAHWPERKPLVKILAWTLMPNHFHLLLKETEAGGISKFLQKLCGSMSVHFNLKYKERGSIFQGAFKGKTVNSDAYMRWLAAYIMVKNVFELYPGGLQEAAERFDDAWKWSIENDCSSIGTYGGTHESPIIDKDILGELFENPESFRRCARDMILARTWEKDDTASLTLE